MDLVLIDKNGKLFMDTYGGPVRTSNDIWSAKRFDVCDLRNLHGNHLFNIQKELFEHSDTWKIYKQDYETRKWSFYVSFNKKNYRNVLGL